MINITGDKTIEIGVGSLTPIFKIHLFKIVQQTYNIWERINQRRELREE